VTSKDGKSKSRLLLQDLKTEKSRRTLALPAVCVEALRAIGPSNSPNG
jgi:hypothetical protein